MTDRADWKTAAIVFTVASTLLLLVHSNWMLLTSDEGITLEPAQRMAAGARIYVDFFAAMSPGSYWLQELAFRIFGFSLWAGRVIVILNFSIQCALLYWLTAKLSSSKAAIAVLLAFAGFQIANPTFLTTQHRWDSGALTLSGLCLAIYCVRREATRRTPWIWTASGALLAAAAWCTPSFVLLVVAEGAWLALAPARRKAAVPFAGGVLIVTAMAVAGLAATGSLAGFFHQMVWLRNNYSGVNFMPYGSFQGTYRKLFEDASGFAGWTTHIVFVTCFALPAILPPVAFIAWLIPLLRGRVPVDERPGVQLLLLAMAGLVMTAYPRTDMVHLAFNVALPYVLVGAALARFAPSRASAGLAGASLLFATLFAASYVTAWVATSRVSSPVGQLRVSPGQLAGFQKLLANVHPGGSLFVYPYMPIQYFLTQNSNPTRFSFLQPGMMTNQDVSDALADLQAHPPEWLLYAHISEAEYREIFPYARVVNWRFDAIEDWLENHYRPLQNPDVTIGEYQLWRRSATAVEAQR